MQPVPVSRCALLVMVCRAALIGSFTPPSTVPKRATLFGRGVPHRLCMTSTADGDREGGWKSVSGDKLFPVLSRMAGAVWEGEMRYAGAALEAAPFTLRGSTRVDLVDRCVTLRSAVVFPNGRTREIAMHGNKTGEAGSSFRLDPVDANGPIYLRLAELAPDTILLQEFNKTDSRVVLTSSISLVEDVHTGALELVQVAHEAGDEPGPPKGFQIWRMGRQKKS